MLGDLFRREAGQKPRLSFLGVLLIFTFFFLVGPLLPHKFVEPFINITFSFLIISSIFTLDYKRSLLISVGLVALLAVILNSITLFQHEFWLDLISTMFAIFLMGWVTAKLFRRVFFVESVEINLVFGSICVYVFLGVLWALIYLMIEHVTPGSFVGIQEALDRMDPDVGVHGTLFHLFLYYSFVTQTTLGYGDISPMTPITKNLAAMQAVMGVFYLATLVAGIVGMLLRQGKSGREEN